MRKLTLAAGIAAMAMTLTAPYALAQTAPISDTATPAASVPGNASGPGMMYDQVQGLPRGQTEVQAQARPQGQQAGYGPGMMSGQGQGGYGTGMMGGYGTGWMGGYGGIWVPILLVLLVAGLVVWIVKQKAR